MNDIQRRTRLLLIRKEQNKTWWNRQGFTSGVIRYFLEGGSTTVQRTPKWLVLTKINARFGHEQAPRYIMTEICWSCPQMFILKISLTISNKNFQSFLNCPYMIVTTRLSWICRIWCKYLQQRIYMSQWFGEYRGFNRFLTGRPEVHGPFVSWHRQT